MPIFPELLALYQRFDRLIDLPPADQQAELESLKQSGDPLALQLEGMLIYHVHQAPTESIFSVDELVSLVKTELPGRIASDLRELSRRLHWDPSSRCFQLGHFSLFDCLSVSTIGATYHAHDQSLDRDVVLLLLFPRWSDNREVQQRSLDASRAVAKIFDPHVAAILGTMHLEGIFAVVRQWIPGSSLDQWLANRDAISINELVIIGRGIASGLQAIHDEQVLHGDLKPANIILRKDSLHPVITDFGTATWISSNESSPWHGGTQGFIAPEILRGEPPSRPSDLYSLGIILQWMATGVLEGASEEDWRRAGERLLGPAPALEARGRFDSFRDYVSNLLAWAPAERPLDARSVVAAMDPWIKPEDSQVFIPKRFHGGTRPLLWDRPGKRRQWMGHTLGLALSAAAATWAGRLLAKNKSKPDSIFIPGTPITALFHIFWKPVPPASAWEFVSQELYHTQIEEQRYPAIRPVQPGHWSWLESQVIELEPVRYEVGLTQIIVRYDTDPGQAFYRIEARFGLSEGGWVVLREGTNLFGGFYSEAVQAQLASNTLAESHSIQLRLGMMCRQPARYPTKFPPIALQVTTEIAPYEAGGVQLWDRVDSLSNSVRG